MAKLNDFGKLILREYNEYKELDKDQQVEYKKNTRRKQLLTSLNIHNLQKKGIIPKEESETLLEDIRNRALIESSAIDIDETDLVRMCAKSFIYTMCENFTNENKQKGDIKKYVNIVRERIAHTNNIDKQEQDGIILSVKAYVKHIREHE